RTSAGATPRAQRSRLQMFGVAQSVSGSLAPRRMLPPVSQRHLDRMPSHLRDAHSGWLRNHPAGA
ncbi:MAG: hypothetical protein ACKOEC_18565, partial [Acidimicrobiia bacterium]